jgi:hypothetical protein
VPGLRPRDLLHPRRGEGAAAVVTMRVAKSLHHATRVGDIGLPACWADKLRQFATKSMFPGKILPKTPNASHRRR